MNYVQRNAHKKQEKVTVVTDQVKEDASIDEIDDATLFALKSEQLAKGLEMIDPNEKMILLIKYQDDLSVKEIAQGLDLGESAVKMRLKRAKEKVVEICKGF